ncbi:hypothetical protein BZG36_03520 [Bifiguratus adelaidae]|uniref:Tudor domain-containing protein n=1 Tax=Bifiguratus adelaidae TaxID=1938954 RepID=A0A261XY16_9FUNG|nr:hypothetical protein BZG36_03520 [Bifiguratus adelaidae]
MSADELTSYRHQLDQVEQLLQNDPQNDEYIKLKADLVELITLTSQLVESQPKEQPSKKRPAPDDASPNEYSSPAYAPPPTKARPWAVGDKCLAKYSGDGKFYPAKITAIGGAGQVFSVMFQGYDDVEVLKAEDIRVIPGSAEAKQSAVGVFEQGADKKKKQKDKEKPKGPKAPSEHIIKQKAWLNFAQGANKKKKLGATPINKKSIFKTPDNPEGRVGVVGSGRGMTNYQRRGKHIYEPTEGGEED